MSEKTKDSVRLIVAEKRALKTILREINNPSMQDSLKDSIVVISADTYDEIIYELHECLDCETMSSQQRRHFSSIFICVKELSILTGALYDAMNSTDYELGLHFPKESPLKVEFAFVVDDYYPFDIVEYIMGNERIIRWQIYEYKSMDSKKLPKIEIHRLIDIKEESDGSFSFEYHD